jgi:predicted site-specific integrase-resolvase
MPEPDFLPGLEAAKVLGVSVKSLRNWADTGKINHIRLPSGTRRYDVTSVLETKPTLERNDPPTTELPKERIVYCRVSTPGQKDHLANQVSAMRAKYPDHRIVTDVGSGLNFKRKGLRSVLELCFAGRLEELRLSHKDRLCRFAFDLLKWILKQHGAEVHVDNDTDGSARDEFCEDLLSVVTVFAARSNGARSYGAKRGRGSAEASKGGEEGDVKRQRPTEAAASGQAQDPAPGSDSDAQDTDATDA